MKCFIMLLFALLAGGPVWAQKKGHAMPPEDALMRQITAALRSKNEAAYIALFPTEEVIVNALEGDEQLALEKSAQTPVLLEKAKARFAAVLAQGKEMGLRWNTVSFSRFELTQARLSRDTLLERLAPVRFEGYLFVRDPLLRKTFALRITDVWQIAGELRGGLVSQVFPALSVTDFEAHVAAQKAAEKKGEKYIALKPPPKDDEEEAEDAGDEPPPASRKNRIVAEQHFYRGTFDRDLKALLYVEAYQGDCAAGICAWAGALMVGDEDWVAVKIARNGAQWTFTEEPENGVMDLTAEQKGYRGTWNATDDKMGYEVQFEEAPPPKRLLRDMESFME